jgi:hypothetical protein
MIRYLEERNRKIDMKVYVRLISLYLLILCTTFFYSCVDSSNSGQIENDIVNARGFDFPTPPIEILNNIDDGKLLINYFNIIQGPDSLYYLYYAAVEDNWDKGDFSQNLYLACSEDGYHYKSICNSSGESIIMSSVIEQSVFIINNCFKLVGNIIEDGKYKLCVWDSSDGITWSGRRVLLEEKHDTQNVIIPKGDHLTLYTRYLKNGTNRKVGVLLYDLDFQPISELSLLSFDYVYNSAASRLNTTQDLLFPTYFNNIEEKRDTCYVKCYIVEGLFSQEIECKLNKWISDDEKWVIVAPGVFYINGQPHIAYCTRTKSHDSELDSSISCYKIIRIEPEY